MMIKITAPDGKKLRDIRTEKLHSEVITEERNARFYVVADSEADPVVEEIDGVTLGERVTDLEDAVVELAELYSEQDDAIVELAEIVGGNE